MRDRAQKNIDDKAPVTRPAAGRELPPPLKGKFPITDAFLNRARRQGRP